MPLNDPYSESILDLGEVPPHLLREVEHFFSIYKDLEGKGGVESHGFEDRAAADRIILEGIQRYREAFPAPG